MTETSQRKKNSFHMPTGLESNFPPFIYSVAAVFPVQGTDFKLWRRDFVDTGVPRPQQSCSRTPVVATDARGPTLHWSVSNRLHRKRSSFVVVGLPRVAQFAAASRRPEQLSNDVCFKCFSFSVRRLSCWKRVFAASCTPHERAFD